MTPVLGARIIADRRVIQLAVNRARALERGYMIDPESDPDGMWGFLVEPLGGGAPEWYADERFDVIRDTD